jgi:flagella basal body P-ring formation protein FlgA
MNNAHSYQRRISAAAGLAALIAFTLPIAAVANGGDARLKHAVAGRAASAKPQAATKVKPAPAPAPVKPVSVTVRPNCEVSRAAFSLGEIADIQGDDKALIAQLAAIEIGASPLPGLSRIINPGDVTVRLRQYHLDGPRVEVALPPGMRITRSGHDIASDEIAQAAIESAKDAIKSQPNSTLEVLGGATRLMVPAGKSQILAGAWRGNPEIGTLTVPVSVLVDGRPVQTVDVALRIHRKMIALVARHDIQIHDILGPQDVALTPIDLASGPGAPITSIDDSLGKRSTRKIPANAAITAEMLEKAPMVSANDSVTIEFMYGALRVTAAGVARQTGAEGDTIHVYATDTRKELDAIVIDKHTVRVDDDSNR